MRTARKYAEIWTERRKDGKGMAWRNREQAPDALIVSVFAWFGLEGGALALLKVNQRNQNSDNAALKKENANLKKQLAKIRKTAGKD